MNELDATKKIIISIILTAVVTGGGVYLVIKQRQGKSENISPTSSDIAVGKPCDARNLKSYNGGGNIQDTKGLQCYMYDDLSDRAIHGGTWTYPSNQETSRKGIWIYPNQMSKPIFLTSSLFDEISFQGVTQNWKPYIDSAYNFVFPSQWKVTKDESVPNQLIIREARASGVGDAPLRLATLTFYPNTQFETTEDFQMIREAPDDWLIPDASNDTFLYTRHFDLNGTPALLVERMGNSDLGTSPYQVSIYVTKPNSYYAVVYTKYHDPNIDLPIELMIKSLHFK